VHAVAQILLPEAWNSLAVWTQVTVTLPVVDVDDGQCQKQTILARPPPASGKSKFGCFETVLVDEHSRITEKQQGIHGRYLSTIIEVAHKY
jgi:hypothetical protein